MTQPVGGWSQVWITEVNIILRQNAPLQFHDWRNIPKEEKREQFNERILAIFDIDLHLDHVEEVVHKYLGCRFKDFRCKLHKHYLSLGDDFRAKRATPYDGVSQENWEVMCNWFEDPKFKKKSVVNKENRQKEMVNHCAGSVSFVPYAAKKGLGRIKLYRETHFSDKRGQWVDPVVEERHDAMVTLEEQANANLDTENSAPPTEDEIVVAVLGEKRGYTWGLGHGVMPPSSSSTRRNIIVEEMQRNIEDANRRLEQAERRNEEAKIRNVEAEKRNEELQRQLKAMQSWQAHMEDMFISGLGSGALPRAQLSFTGNPSGVAFAGNQGQEMQERQIHMNVLDQMGSFPFDAHSGRSSINTQLNATGSHHSNRNGRTDLG